MTKWQDGVNTIAKARESYTPERLAYYAEQTAREFAFFKFEGSRILDVGCGDGCPHLFPDVHYVGVDVVPTRGKGFTFKVANAEDLPFADQCFTSVLSRSVLQHIEDPDQALSEMARVLVDGGRLCVEVCVSDPNPIFLHLWTLGEALTLIGKVFKIESWELMEGRLLCINGRKP